MRVFVVDPPAFTPPYDDALCAALARRGISVELVTSRFVHGAVPEPVGYERSEPFAPVPGALVARSPRSPLRVPAKALGHLAGLRALRARCAHERPDVVHWQWAPVPWLDARVLRAASRSTGATIFTAHDVLPRRSASRVAVWRDLYVACDRVVAHSESSRRRLVAEVGCDPGRVVVIEHALLDLEAAAAGPPPRDVAAPGSTILFFGLLRPDKGLDTLIEALPAVVAAIPEARLEIVGSARMPLAPLRERAAALGVEGRIAWDVRFVSDAERADAFRRADVVALPYRWIEGSGVLATALAFARPVVASDVGGFRETLERFDLGEPVAPDDAPALAAALVRALGDGAFRERAAAGLARARRELTWERAAEMHEALYLDAIERRA